MTAPSYWLRPAGPDDGPSLLAIYASTRAEELALTQWTAPQVDAFVRQQHQAQQQHYGLHYPQSQCQLIMQGEAQIAGRLWLDRRPQTLHILDITLLPGARGQGLGTQCLRDLLQQAGSQQRAVSIYVELHNPARRLYERLGFDADGEPQGLHQHMVWRASSPSPQPTTDEECLPC